MKKPTILASPYGPVIPWTDSEVALPCLRLLIGKTEEIARKLNAVAWRIEPRIELPVPRILHEFGEAPVNHVRNTLYLDLSPSLETILSRMKHKCRYNISLAERNGVKVRQESCSDAAAILYALLSEASVRDSFALEHSGFFKVLVEQLQPTGMLKLFVAEHEGDRLGALVLITHGKQATYLYGGISNLKRNLMIGYALQWRAIQEAKSAGCINYDFYGFDQFLAPGNAYSRFSRFKSGFGGEPKRFIGAHDYMFIDKLVDNIVDFFQDLAIDVAPNDLAIDNDSAN